MPNSRFINNNNNYVHTCPHVLIMHCVGQPPLYFAMFKNEVTQNVNAN